MSRIIEKYCGFHRNDTLLKRQGNSFCFNENLVALNSVRITRRHAFLLLVSIIFGALKMLVAFLGSVINNENRAL
ncbi:hypothetical protein JT180_07685 [Helicobacter pylori]|nr:hypothetical protein [Helicobacter pylori]